MEAGALKIIENYCNRTFGQATYTNEEYKGSGTEYLNLRNYPIVTLTKVEENYGSVAVASWSEVTANVYALKPSGQIYTENGFFRVERMYRVTYTAGYASLPADVQYCVDTLSAHLNKMQSSAGLKKETLGEYSYERFDQSGNLINDLGLSIILSPYRTPVV